MARAKAHASGRPCHVRPNVDLAISAAQHGLVASIAELGKTPVELDRPATINYFFFIIVKIYFKIKNHLKILGIQH